MRLRRDSKMIKLSDRDGLLLLLLLLLLLVDYLLFSIVHAGTPSRMGRQKARV